MIPRLFLSAPVGSCSVVQETTVHRASGGGSAQLPFALNHTRGCAILREAAIAN